MAPGENESSTPMTRGLKPTLCNHEKIFIMTSWSITESSESFTKLHVPLLGYIEVD